MWKPLSRDTRTTSIAVSCGASPLVIDEASGPIVYLLMSYGGAEEVSEYAAALARENGLLCFDPQGGLGATRAPQYEGSNMAEVLVFHHDSAYAALLRSPDPGRVPGPWRHRPTAERARVQAGGAPGPLPAGPVRSAVRGA